MSFPSFLRYVRGRGRLAGRKARAVVADDAKPSENGCIFPEKPPLKGSARRKSPPKKFTPNGAVTQLSKHNLHYGRLHLSQLVSAAIFSTTAPLTPHRIELQSSDNEEQQNGEEIEEKKAVPQPKARKRLIDGAATKKDESHKLTEYFPVRRSVRKTKKTVLEEKQRCLEHLLRHRVEEGLEVTVVYFMLIHNFRLSVVVCLL